MEWRGSAGECAHVDADKHARVDAHLFGQLRVKVASEEHQERLRHVHYFPREHVAHHRDPHDALQELVPIEGARLVVALVGVALAGGLGVDVDEELVEVLCVCAPWRARACASVSVGKASVDVGALSRARALSLRGEAATTALSMLAAHVAREAMWRGTDRDSECCWRAPGTRPSHRRCPEAAHVC